MPTKTKKKATKKTTRKKPLTERHALTKLRKVMAQNQRISKYESIAQKSREKALQDKHTVDKEIEILRQMISDAPQGDLPLEGSVKGK